MSGKPFTVTRELAKELKRIDERMSQGRWVPHSAVREQMLRDMATNLRRMVKTFERTGRGAKKLLECLVIAEAEGVDPDVLADIRRGLGQRVIKRRAA